ncbi:translation elongation factor 4 [Patescibacteria group bacterium]|nr:translation elongation factor 4 [Patescibacteria group bacterium]MBU1421284.1 translation elongation factor 4 [Patescibacteria group bacterium]MBU2415630.1 translation elongation factor 4 [Patescibacteria group bacterium]MBU2456893.1 translation elongation factor 4 [Patescibacteria group bacterium]
MNNIRNFCIIAHIDHGKSTLADRMLELTGTIEKRKMKEQVLDRMDLERERGITIKLQPVRINYQLSIIHPVKSCGAGILSETKLFNKVNYELNLIDTPGHVDFSYEVSRSLAAVEGAVLLVDASQGIQAQTLANLYLAIDQNLTIIPVINKIDLPAANIKKTSNAIVKLLGCKEEEIILASGKTGKGVEEILQAVVERVPAPHVETRQCLVSTTATATRALIFDSNYDKYRGIVAYVKIVNGKIKKGDQIYLMSNKTQSEALDVGIFKPDYQSTNELKTGEIGYIVTGFKEVNECEVGDTITTFNNQQQQDNNIKPLPGYKKINPMVFAGIFPQEGNDFKDLREAMQKLKLSDAAMVYEPEQSEALGHGFRCGFLGLLHLEIFQERLKREFNLDLIITTPSVAYRVHTNGDTHGTHGNNEKYITAKTPQEFPDPSKIGAIKEPWVKLDIVAPKEYTGNIIKLVQAKRGVYKNTEYIDEDKIILHYNIPMSAILTDFYNKVKSVSSGYASINYEYLDYQSADVVKMDILVAENIIQALSIIVYRDEVFKRGKEIVKILKETLQKEMFVVKLQAAIGSNIIAAERISAMSKDVTAKLYGGDVTRKRKLLEKQKKGKKKMMASGKGSVKIPSDAFIKILKI